MHDNDTSAPVQTRASQLGFKAPATKAFHAYWQSLRNSAGKMPVRAQFDPVSIPKLLPDIIVFERLEKEKFLVRLQGTAFRERDLTDRTGLVLERIADNAVRNTSIEAMEDCLTRPCGLHIQGVELNRNGRKLLTETAAFPLADEKGQVKFLVALVATLETLGFQDGEPTTDELIEIRHLEKIAID